MFYLINLVFWHGVVGKIFFSKNGHGDLGRLGSFYTTEAITKQMRYNTKHVEFEEYLHSGIAEHFDIITIGDSFSNGRGGAYYQDYLTEQYGKTVLNVKTGSYNAVQMLYLLDDLGYLDEIKPQTVILESVERGMQDRFGNVEVGTLSISREAFIKSQLTGNKTETDSMTDKGKLLPDIMLDANIRFIKNHFFALHHFGKLSNSVYITQLNRDEFTNSGQENMLLFLNDDLWYLEKQTNYKKINENLNLAADALAKKKISMIFMTAVDKYDLYYPYITDHQGTQENPFFIEFEKLPKDYIFIDTKQILRGLLADGEKDVYWSDDTHWSWKAQQVVVNELAKNIN